jgi:hypothetical protein
MQITKLIRLSLRADYGMYQPHPALRTPIYRPSVHLSIYGLFCNHPRQVYTTLQQASTLVIGTYSHTITLLIQTYSLSIFQIDLPLQLFNQLFERFERRKRHNFQYTTIIGPTSFLTLVLAQVYPKHCKNGCDK